MALSVGTKAPSFSLKDATEKVRNLSEFSGKCTVLYFYPKDKTSGFTLEAIDFTNELKSFEKLNTVIIGISPDSCKSHQGFITKQKLKHVLLADEEKKMLNAYDVWKEKSMYGRKYMGVVRTTYLIDPKGKIVYVWDKVKVPGHIAEVKQKLIELQK